MIAILAMLFMVAASSVLGTFWFRNGTFEDGQVVTAPVLKVTSGRTGEAEVEYFADGKRYQAWVYCGTSCPNEGDRMEVEYSINNPTNVVRNRARPFSMTSVVAFFVTGSGIVICGILLRRDIISLRRT
ncbi:hypothetical protein KBX37_14935 [Micromonospora sp. U56]|uniref:hypothetical protein n=1 Tax=Micromonospora sp. U56 TaxID=2824900 RepID=UPI001B3650A3|nr:hypothetical protein [Micromonospora sp. U56]MBQ0894376.1 hypothetical protein [Micromonospora sp. U56]